MPETDTKEAHLVFENAIFRIDEEGTGFLMLSITGNGRKEWIYYTKDIELFLSHLNQCLVGHTQYPIQIETKEDPTWSAWRSFLENTKNPA